MIKWFYSLIELFCLMFDRCTHCRLPLRLESKVVDRIDGMICEESMYCSTCKSLQDHFAYGSFERQVWQHYAEEAHPIWSRVFKLFRRKK